MDSETEVVTEKYDRHPNHGGDFYNMTPAMRAALNEIIEAKKLIPNPGYKTVAAKHGVSPGSLRQVYSKYSRGLIILGQNLSPAEKEIQINIEQIRQLRLIDDAEKYINDLMEGALKKAKNKGTMSGYFESGVAQLRDEAMKWLRWRTMKEENHEKWMAKLKAEKQQAIEKRVHGVVLDKDGNVPENPELILAKALPDAPRVVEAVEVETVSIAETENQPTESKTE